jgi:hypothetical protein
MTQSFFLLVVFLPWNANAPAVVPHSYDDAAAELAHLQLEATHRELVQVESDLRKVRVEMSFWKAREQAFAQMEIPHSAVEDRLSQDPAIAKNLLRVASAREELAILEKVSKSGKLSPGMERLRTELASAEQGAETAKNAFRRHVIDQLRAKALDEYKGKLTQYQEQIDLLTEMRNVLQADAAQLREKTKGLRSPIEVRLMRMEQDIADLKASILELKKNR